MRRWVLVVGALLLLPGCSGQETTPWVIEQGPTADPGDFPDPPAVTTQARSELDLAMAEIEDRLAVQDEPLQTLAGALPDGSPFVVEVVSLTATESSVLARLRLLPASGGELDLPAGGLSGSLPEEDRSISDLALIDDTTGRQLLPTVHRPDVTREGPQRCLCSQLPRSVPAEGVLLSAHFVRPADGFSLVRVRVPGAEEGPPISVG